MAYPELVSRGVSKSRKYKWLVKVGACKDVNPLFKKKSWPGEGFPGNQKTPLDTPLSTVVRSALMYGAETWALKKAQENKLEVAEMRMLRWMCGVTKLDKK